MKEIKNSRRNRIKKDLDYYKNLKKDVEKQIKILATREAVKKRKELYRKRMILGAYILELFEKNEEAIDNKNLGTIFDEFLAQLSAEDKESFVNFANNSSTEELDQNHSEAKQTKKDDDDEDDKYDDEDDD